MTHNATQLSDDPGFDAVLARIELAHLQAPLRGLLEHFDGVPWADELVGFQGELDTAIDDLTVLHAQGSQPAQLVQRLRIKIPRFEAWRIRACRPGQRGQTDFWNPLTQSYRSFVAGGDPNGLVTRVCADDYPAEDIIRQWCNTEIGIGC